MASSAPPFSQTLMSKLKIVMLYSIVDIFELDLLFNCCKKIDLSYRINSISLCSKVISRQSFLKLFVSQMVEIDSFSSEGNNQPVKVEYRVEGARVPVEKVFVVDK